MPRCKSCGAPIQWAENSQSRKMVPLDARPVKVYRLNLYGQCVLVDAYRTHFETCPDAGKYRKKKGKKSHD